MLYQIGMRSKKSFHAQSMTCLNECKDNHFWLICKVNIAKYLRFFIIFAFKYGYVLQLYYICK